MKAIQVGARRAAVHVYHRRNGLLCSCFHRQLCGNNAEQWESTQRKLQKAARDHARTNRGRPPKGVHADDVRAQRRILDQEAATGEQAADIQADGEAGGAPAKASRKRPASRKRLAGDDNEPRRSVRQRSSKVWPSTLRGMPHGVNRHRLPSRCPTTHV